MTSNFQIGRKLHSVLYKNVSALGNFCFQSLVRPKNWRNKFYKNFLAKNLLKFEAFQSTNSLIKWYKWRLISQVFFKTISKVLSSFGECLLWKLKWTKIAIPSCLPRSPCLRKNSQYWIWTNTNPYVIMDCNFQPNQTNFFTFLLFLNISLNLAKNVIKEIGIEFCVIFF